MRPPKVRRIRLAGQTPCIDRPAASSDNATDASARANSQAEASQVAFEGNTISFIDVDLAAAASPNAEVVRVLVGTSEANVQTRPFIPSFTPDGRFIIVPNFRSNNVSIVDLARALAHDPGAEVARIALTRPDGLAARPKGSAVTSDGRYAVISGGPRTAFAPSGTVWIIDLNTRAVVATVTG